MSHKNEYERSFSSVVIVFGKMGCQFRVERTESSVSANPSAFEKFMRSKKSKHCPLFFREIIFPDATKYKNATSHNCPFWPNVSLVRWRGPVALLWLQGLVVCTRLPWSGCNCNMIWFHGTRLRLAQPDLDLQNQPKTCRTEPGPIGQATKLAQ